MIWKRNKIVTDRPPVHTIPAWKSLENGMKWKRNACRYGTNTEPFLSSCEHPMPVRFHDSITLRLISQWNKPVTMWCHHLSTKLFCYWIETVFFNPTCAATSIPHVVTIMPVNIAVLVARTTKWIHMPEIFPICIVFYIFWVSCGHNYASKYRCVGSQDHKMNLYAWNLSHLYRFLHFWASVQKYTANVLVFCFYRFPINPLSLHD